MDQPNSKGRDKTKPHAAHRCPGFTSVAWPPPDASRLAALVSRSTAANLHKRTPKVKAGVTPPPFTPSQQRPSTDLCSYNTRA